MNIINKRSFVVVDACLSHTVKRVLDKTMILLKMLYQSKVLLVDDNKSSQYVLSKILQKLRCNVISAENGKEAMNILKMNNFNLVIIESRLPDMNGVNLLQQMMNRNINVKKIVLTGYPSEEDKIKFFELGVDYYVSKPIKPKKLLQIIKKCVNL